MENNKQQKMHTQITVDAKKFIDAIKDVASIVDKRPPLPILENILAEVKPGHVYLTTQNVSENLRYTIRLECQNEGEGSFLIPAATGKKMKGKGMVTITAEETEDGKVKVDMFNTSFHCQPTTDFPLPYNIGKPEDTESLTFSLSDEHKTVAKCWANDNLRLQMNGVYFDTDSKYIVASDGHAMRAVPTDFGKCIGGFIVDKGAFKLMNGDIRITYNKEKFQTQKASGAVDASFYMAEWGGGARKIYTRTIDGRFPNWKSVIPTTMPYRWKFANTEEIKIALDTIFNSMDCKKIDRLAVIRITDGSDLCDIIAEDLDYNIKSAHKVHLDGPAVGNYQIGINVNMARTLLDKLWDGNLYCADSSRAMMFGCKTEGSVLLIMPMITNEYKFPYEAQPKCGNYPTFSYKDYSAEEEPKKPEPAADSEINTPSDAEEVIDKANANEPQPKNFIPRFPDRVIWVNEDKKEADMVAGIHKYLPIAEHTADEDATIYYKIPTSDSFMLCLETSIYLKAMDSMVVFSFYSGKTLAEDVCKMTNGDKVSIFTWEEGMQSLDIIHQVNKDVAM